MKFPHEHWHEEHERQCAELLKRYKALKMRVLSIEQKLKEIKEKKVG